jgi:uncharacterized secreted protein with C-terminal beta-propeller domain
MTGHPRVFRLGVGLLLTTTVLTGCTDRAPKPPRHDPAVPALSLVAFDSCAELLTSLRTATREAVTPYGLSGNDRIYTAADGGMARAGSNAQVPTGTPEHSNTNTHEVGVDEPDLVKTDGRRIVTASHGKLTVVDAATRKVTGSVDLADDSPETSLLLAGDHALVLSSDGPTLRLVDLGGQPKVLATYSMPGALLDARQVGSVARVVVSSVPRINFPVDGWVGPGQPGEEQRLAANREAVDNAPIGDWLPRYTVDNNGTSSTGAVDCASVSRPTSYSGTSMLTVLTFDLSRSTLDKGRPVSVVADGQTVYANGSNLYVATDERWRTWRTDMRASVPRADEKTNIYRFDIAGTAKPRFVASGTVPGWLLSQYSMSEWKGDLRIATTVGQGVENRPGESAVYTLDPDLRQVGRIDGLGKGERIYAVRFIGPTGYVVTFRQTDPLYVLDLRDPKAPKSTGELKINGYSAYLHPAGDGRLIGVGATATDQGRRTGAQVSLFDVSDPAKPTRIANHELPGTYTEAEFDPHAFLYWPATGLLVLPTASAVEDTGALALTVGGNTINQIGAVGAHGGEPIRRSLVIGDALWTVSGTALEARAVTNLTQLAAVPLS